MALESFASLVSVALKVLSVMGAKLHVLMGGVFL